MRALYPFLILILLPIPAQAGEDYDLYDTRGNRIGHLRERPKAIVVDESPTQTGSSFADALMWAHQIRERRAQREFLEAQRLELQRAQIQQQLNESGYVHRPQPVSREQVEFLVSRWYNDAMFAKFIDKLKLEELRAFWKVKSDEIVWNGLKWDKPAPEMEQVLKDFRAQVADSQTVQTEREAILTMPLEKFRQRAFRSFSAASAKAALDITADKARNDLLEWWQSEKDVARSILSELSADLLNSDDPIKEEAVRYMVPPPYSQHSPARSETEATWKKEIAQEVKHLRTYRQQTEQERPEEPDQRRPTSRSS